MSLQPAIIHVYIYWVFFTVSCIPISGLPSYLKNLLKYVQILFSLVYIHGRNRKPLCCDNGHLISRLLLTREHALQISLNGAIFYS